MYHHGHAYAHRHRPLQASPGHWTAYDASTTPLASAGVLIEVCHEVDGTYWNACNSLLHWMKHTVSPTSSAEPADAPRNQCKYLLLSSSAGFKRRQLCLWDSCQNYEWEYAASSLPGYEGCMYSKACLHVNVVINLRASPVGESISV